MSPGPDTLIQSALERRNLLGLMAALPLLRDLSTDLLEEVAREVEWFSLPGGTTLFTAGDPVDGLYVVVNGALGVYVASPAGGARLAGEIAAGETAGEMEVISGKKRSATLISLRDTEVARLPVKTFEKLLASHPESLRHITNNLIERLESLQRADVPPHVKPKAFAIVPNGLDVDAAGFGLNLAEQLRRLGRAELVLSSQASDRTSHWFHRLERANDFVLYVSDPQPSNWTKLCLRQADSLLLLARCERAPRPWAALQAIREDPATAFAADIVLLHEGSKPSAHTRGWLDVQPFRRHHHVRGPRDIARIARLLTGHALGVVLSGGGARGFAHIGAMRALEEAKLAVDAIGATSIGAIVGAAWAAGWSYEEMVERFRRSFVDSNPLGDYTLPLVSLVAGRRVGKLLNAAFGETHIEDLQLPYFCVSANLTTGQAAVHRRGTVSLAARIGGHPRHPASGIHRQADLRGWRDHQQSSRRPHARDDGWHGRRRRHRGKPDAGDQHRDGRDAVGLADRGLVPPPPLAHQHPADPAAREHDQQRGGDRESARTRGPRPQATAGTDRSARLAGLRAHHRAWLPLCEPGAGEKQGCVFEGRPFCRWAAPGRLSRRFHSRTFRHPGQPLLLSYEPTLDRCGCLSCPRGDWRYSRQEAATHRPWL
jgi:NTE family protein